MMANHYSFRNGLFLAVSSTTMKEMVNVEKTTDLLRSVTPIVARLQALLDFAHFESAKTGENIGRWLEDIHGGVGCKPEFINSHTVDGASNAGLSVETLSWNTSEDRSQKIVADQCDAHKISTTADQATGVSGHVSNLNPTLGTCLSLLHWWLERIYRNGGRRKVVLAVQKENGREKCPSMEPAVVTRWGSRHRECERANANQHDLDIAMRRMVSPGGVDEELYNEHSNIDDGLNEVLIHSDQWHMIQQVESGLQPLKDFSIFSQHATVVAHLELFEAQRTLELLKAPFFVMCDNVSRYEGLRHVADLTKRPKNQLVTADDFLMPKNEHTKIYEACSDHEMIEEVGTARRLSWRLLALRLKLVKRVNTVSGSKSTELDNDLSASLMAGLENAPELNEMKILGALINPLFQCGPRMIDAGLCTEEQYESGKEELLDRMTRYHERKSETVTVVNDETLGKSNKWSKHHSQKSDDAPRNRAEAEFDLFEKYNDAQYLPDMKPLKVLGAIDEDGNPQEPVYAIGPVTGKGTDLRGGKNHADYVDKKNGYYDVVKYLEDFSHMYPAIHCVGVGQTCSHITTEVDCESLFSQAGHYNHPRRARTNIRMYERLVVGKHRLHRVHCSVPRVKALFMKRWKDKSWEEKDERDDQEFLELEMEIYKEMFPHSAELLFKEEEEDEDEEKINSEGDAEVQCLGEKKNNESDESESEEERFDKEGQKIGSSKSV
jgi:hypothetical protein